MDLEEAKAWNDCAGEGQQQFNWPTDRPILAFTMVQQIMTELSAAATENEKLCIDCCTITPTIVHSPLKITVNADGIYEVRKQLQDLKIEVTYLKLHMIIKTGTKAELPWHPPHTCRPASSTGVCIQIGNTEMLLAKTVE
jgi:hypothetical protein